MGKVWNGFETDDKSGQSRRVDVTDEELAAKKEAEKKEAVENKELAKPTVKEKKVK